jgi:hypothetical protein
LALVVADHGDGDVASGLFRFYQHAFHGAFGVRTYDAGQGDGGLTECWKLQQQAGDDSK